MPVSVGIIANPASGRDIRRLAAHGSVFDNQEKINIIRRVVLALEAMEVDEVWLMPDYSGLGFRAVDGLKLSLKVRLLDLEAQGCQEDSTRAAALLAEMKAGCIVTLGGDGTNRVVAKGCRDVPLVPISTGTNNVFPYMVEGTVAGLAAGLAASGLVDPDEVCRRAPILELYINGRLVDLALIDLVVTEDVYTSVRAVWEADLVKEIFLTRSRPSAIGFSSIGGYVHPLPPDSGRGIHLVLGAGAERVRAPIAPGLLCWLPIASHRLFEPGDEIPIGRAPAMIALDGERELGIRAGDRASVKLNLEGPRVVDIEKTLEAGCRSRVFHETI